MPQSIPSPMPFGEREDDRLDDYRSGLLTRYGADDIEPDEDDGRWSLVGPALVALVVLGFPVIASLVLLAWG